MGHITRIPASFDASTGELRAAERARLRRLEAAWHARRGDRHLPSRADFDPLELREHLSHLFIVEALPDGDYRYRLIGTAVTRAMGRDVTGLRPSQIYAPDDARRMAALFDKVRAKRQPVWRAGRAWLTDREYAFYETVFLPLGSDGAHADQILAGVAFSEPTTDELQALRAEGLIG